MTVQQVFHLLHRLAQPHEDRPADDGVADVQFDHLVDRRHGRRIVVIQPVSGVQSDADGSFAMFGTAPPEPMRLHGEARQHLETDTGPLRAGATIDLRLQREGSLSGRVLLPEWLPRNAASVHVQPIGQEQEGRSWRIRDRNGQFRIRALSPGTYTLTLGVRNLPEPLVALHDVRIAPGENRLPRLQGLDLRSALYRYRLRAVDDGGRLMTQLDGPILWHMSAPNGARQDVGFRWQQGRAEIITAVAFLELTALARGHTPTEVALGPGDHDIYLRRLQPVIMDLPGVRAMAGFARAIRVSMILADDSGLPQSLAGVDQRSGRSFSFPRWELAKSGGGWLDGNDRAHAVLSRNGVYAAPQPDRGPGEPAGLAADRPGRGGARRAGSPDASAHH